jgi:hypothetical protein
VFTDINLGQGKNGIELAAWVLTNRPGVKDDGGRNPPAAALWHWAYIAEALHRTRLGDASERDALEAIG